MNKTKIEWCDRTWNPVTGCLHKCPYCYARNIAHRFGNKEGETVFESYELKCHDRKNKIIKSPFPYGFDPTFHRYRLDEPQAIKKPQNIFVCSMADLFGEWVPDEWIEKVFDACHAAPQHRYLFLTKNPKRYKQFWREMPENMWFGHTTTGGNHYTGQVYLHQSWKRFVSIEPMLEPIYYFNAGYTDWVIIGAETGNRKGKVIPKKEWIEKILLDCQSRNVPIFMKNSLADIWGEPLIQEYPWKRGEICQ